MSTNISLLKEVTEMKSLNFEDRIRAIVDTVDISLLPLTVELSGLPRVGKSGFADALIDLIHRSGCKAVIYQQDQYNCPILDNWSIDFTSWGITTFVKQFYEFRNSGQQIIIADRGLFDATVWLRLKYEKGICDRQTYQTLRNLAMTSPWWTHQTLVIVFDAPISTALKRAKERRLYNGESFVTNKHVLPLLRKAYREESALINKDQVQNNKPDLVKYFRTNRKNLHHALYEATELVISSLETHAQKNLGDINNDAYPPRSAEP